MRSGRGTQTDLTMTIEWFCLRFYYHHIVWPWLRFPKKSKNWKMSWNFDNFANSGSHSPVALFIFKILCFLHFKQNCKIWHTFENIYLQTIVSHTPVCLHITSSMHLGATHATKNQRPQLTYDRASPNILVSTFDNSVSPKPSL